MSIPSVLVTPGAYNYFTLDIGQSPGIATITSGGDRKIEIADQGQPLTLGKNTVVRSRENVVVTYGFKLWTTADFATRDNWIAIFEAGSQSQPPRVYTITDLNIPWLKRVIYQGAGPQKPKAPGGPWDWELTLHEYVRVKPFGGPILPPDADDKTLNAIGAAIVTQQARLAAAVAASKRTKG